MNRDDRYGSLVSTFHNSVITYDYMSRIREFWSVEYWKSTISRYVSTVLKFPLKCKTAAVSATLHPFSDLGILKRASQCMRGARQYQKGEDRPVTLLQPLCYSPV